MFDCAFSRNANAHAFDVAAKLRPFHSIGWRMNSLLCMAVVVIAQPGDTPLRFETARVIATLPAEHAAKLPLGRLTSEAGEATLRVALVDDATKKSGPPMLGKYERAANELAFTPRFPLEAGHTYRATLHAGTKTVTLDYRVPELKNQSPPKIVKIYPTTDVLPANHLKFYIYFDRPMRGGKELFNLIQIVDDKGKVIAEPWLDEEIWDEENNCLIIYIHPGRIKWGVELRELLGPVLFEKREYALVLCRELSDLAGNKIGSDFVKKFRTTPEDRVRIDLSQWKLTAPAIKTRDAVTLAFPKSLDHRSLDRFLSVKDAQGNPVEGAIALGKDERTWSFTPAQPWQKSGYHIDVNGKLEDVAGNTPDRAFDFDLKAPKLAPQKLRFDFSP